jgi:nitrilase
VALVTSVRAAAVQATPVFLDRDATVDKVCGLIKQAASEGAGLIVFPETFVPTYPDWVWRAPAWEGPVGELYERLLEGSVEVPGPVTDVIGKVVQRAKAYVALGVNEREPAGTTVYNTLVYFGPDGEILGTHRKLMPTGGERLVWGMGDGSDLDVHATPFGRLGGLICWENYMPLARTTLYSKGVEVWVAPTWDQGESWIATIRHIAKEGRVYVISCAPLLRGSDVPEDLPGRELWGGDDDWMNEGWATIVGPDGEILAGPLKREEGIVTAELDLGVVRRNRVEFDPVGHYSRPDVFRLIVDESRKRTVSRDGF